MPNTPPNQRRVLQTAVSDNFPICMQCMHIMQSMSVITMLAIKSMQLENRQRHIPAHLAMCVPCTSANTQSIHVSIIGAYRNRYALSEACAAEDDGSVAGKLAAASELSSAAAASSTPRGCAAASVSSGASTIPATAALQHHSRH